MPDPLWALLFQYWNTLTANDSRSFARTSTNPTHGVICEATPGSPPRYNGDECSPVSSYNSVMKGLTPDPIPELKKQLAGELVQLLGTWSQWNAAVLLNVSQTQISELKAGKLERFSLDRLVRLLVRAGRTVEIRTTRARAYSPFRHDIVDNRNASSRTPGVR